MYPFKNFYFLRTKVVSSIFESGKSQVLLKKVTCEHNIHAKPRLSANKRYIQVKKEVQLNFEMKHLGDSIDILKRGKGGLKLIQSD